VVGTKIAERQSKLLGGARVCETSVESWWREEQFKSAASLSTPGRRCQALASRGATPEAALQGHNKQKKGHNSVFIPRKQTGVRHQSVLLSALARNRRSGGST
jgi:hypothetical protein